MTALNTYRRWLARVEDDALRAELSALDEVRDAAQIEDRFYRDLAFGTGGLRGVLGAGTNRMNVYVVRRATQGLAAYLKAAGLPLRCAIAYDSRIGSARFARETARVLAANGVTAYLYPRLEPTPALSWAVRYYGCGAGVCVTASHNPAAYNGYKVYGPDGCQITLEAADAVSKHIGAADHFDGVRLCGFADALADGTIRMIGEDCLEAFLDAVERRSVWDGDRSALRVVYTPLNGTGRECVTRLLHRIGVTDVTLVPEQAWPDGSFPTCPYPNPEERAALERGLALARKTRADLLLGTDPDCDRMGAAAAANGLPAKVEPWVPGEKSDDSPSPKLIMPPMGNPPATPLANVTMFGVTPPRSSRWNANHEPVRPMPVCTSSTIMSARCSSHSARTSRMYWASSGSTPASPWMSSMMTAEMGPLPVASNAAFIASMSFASTNSMFGTSGSNGSRIAGFHVAERAPIVRPWNPWVSAMMRYGLSVPSSAHRCAPYSFAILSAASFASAPEFPK